MVEKDWSLRLSLRLRRLHGLHNRSHELRDGFDIQVHSLRSMDRSWGWGRGWGRGTHKVFHHHLDCAKNHLLTDFFELALVTSAYDDDRLIILIIMILRMDHEHDAIA